MKRLLNSVVLYAMVSAASAAQIDYQGHFFYVDGGEALSPHISTHSPTNAFSGSSTFDLNNPNQTEISMMPGAESLVLGYDTNVQIDAHSGPHAVSSNAVELEFMDNVNVNADYISQYKFTDYAIPGIWDIVCLDADFKTPSQGSLSLFAFYSSDTFSAMRDFSGNAFQNLFNINPALGPAFIGFFAKNNDGSFYAAGLVDNIAVTSVPLPGMVWLLAGAFGGLVYKQKSQA